MSVHRVYSFSLLHSFRFSTICVGRFIWYARSNIYNWTATPFGVYKYNWQSCWLCGTRKSNAKNWMVNAWQYTGDDDTTCKYELKWRCFTFLFQRKNMVNDKRPKMRKLNREKHETQCKWNEYDEYVQMISSGRGSISISQNKKVSKYKKKEKSSSGYI